MASPIISLWGNTKFRARERGGAVGAACLHNSETVGVVPPQISIGLEAVETVAVPKLGFVGHKGKLNGRKHLSKKSPSFIGSAAHLADKPLFEAATKVLSSLS